MEEFLKHVDWPTVLSVALGRALQIAFLYLLYRISCSVVRRVVPRIIQTAVLKGARAVDADEIAKRHQTLSSVGTKTISAALWIIFAFMSLSLLGLDISPILAGVGVAGIAIGFGAQSLVKDLLAGLFILIENQYAKGDVVKIAGISGLVEDVNLRRTVLRDQDGAVHTVPNGEVRVASNLTRDWSRVNLNVVVGFAEDVDRVIALIDRVSAQLATDPEYSPLIIEAPRAARVDAFEDSGLAIKILGVTKPSKQWEVSGELRKRIQKAFNEEGIEVPYPRKVPATKSPN